MLAILGLDHKTIFAKLDANKDGYISFDEFQRVVSGKGSCPDSTMSPCDYCLTPQEWSGM